MSMSLTSDEEKARAWREASCDGALPIFKDIEQMQPLLKETKKSSSTMTPTYPASSDHTAKMVSPDQMRTNLTFRSTQQSTVDRGDDSTTELKQSRRGNANCSLARGVNSHVEQTMQEPPDWTYRDPREPPDTAAMSKPSSPLARRDKAFLGPSELIKLANGDTKAQPGDAQSFHPNSWLWVFMTLGELGPLQTPTPKTKERKESGYGLRNLIRCSCAAICSCIS